MSSIVIAGDTSGSVTLQAPSVAGSTILTLPATSGTVQTSGAGFTTNGVAYASSTSALATGSALVFDGTNLGIGTTTLPQKLNIGGINATNNTNQNSIEFQDSNGNTNFRITGGRGSSGNEGYGVFSTITGGTMTERMRIDSAGNVGIGVTPSAWSATGAGGPVLQIKRGMFFGADSETRLIHNAYYDGSDFRYIATDPATNYQQSSGQHRFYTAASGTAGNTVSFTQAMTLNASGNLGIGTTSPSVRLDVVGSSGIRVNEDGSGTKIITIRSDWAGVDPAINVTTNNSLLLMTNNTERARIDTSGNLLVGGTSNPVGARILSENASGNQLALRYTSIATYYNSVDSSGNLIWTKDGTERARITAGGYFKASDTGTYASSTGTYHEFVNSSADNLIKFRNSNASNPYGFPISYSAASPNGTGNAFWDCDDTGGARGAFRSNGGLANYSANNVNLSDRREKTNFAPATSYLDKICAIPVQTFNYIDQNLEEDGGLTLGVVAQDVQAVAPELVMESNWAKQGDEPKMRLSIYQTDLQYALMKCIQEQQAIIESLKARLDAANL